MLKTQKNRCEGNSAWEIRKNLTHKCQTEDLNVGGSNPLLRTIILLRHRVFGANHSEHDREHSHFYYPAALRDKLVRLGLVERSLVGPSRFELESPAFWPRTPSWQDRPSYPTAPTAAPTFCLRATLLTFRRLFLSFPWFQFHLAPSRVSKVSAAGRIVPDKRAASWPSWLHYGLPRSSQSC